MNQGVSTKHFITPDTPNPGLIRLKNDPSKVSTLIRMTKEGGFSDRKMGPSNNSSDIENGLKSRFETYVATQQKVNIHK